MDAYQDSPLLGEPTLPPREGLHKPLIYGLLIGLGVAVFVLLVWAVQVWLNPAPPPPPPPAAAAPVPALQTPPLPLGGLMRDAYPTSFANEDRRPAIPEAHLVQDIPPPPPVAAKKPADAPETPPKPPPQAAAPPPTTTTTPGPAASAAPAKPRTKNWLFASTAHYGDKAEKKGEKEREQSQSLITPATWVRSVDPTRMLYRGAVLHGIVLEQVVSDIPSDIKIHIDRPVLDGEGMGRTLIPQNAEAIVRQVREVRYGDKRLGVELVQVRFRDGTGTLLQFKGVGADKSGAAGFTGKVDNKLPQLALGILGTAALSIGARAAGGNQDRYQPSIQQDLGREVAGGVNQAGQDILRRELAVNPTITVAAKEQVTLEVLENISLLSDPIIVKK